MHIRYVESRGRRLRHAVSRTRSASTRFFSIIGVGDRSSILQIIQGGNGCLTLDWQKKWAWLSCVFWA